MNNKMSKKKMYEYVVLHHKMVNDDVETTVITSPTSILSKDERSLGMIIARGLPENLLDDLDNVEIIIRPF
jgi:hypothetical protein